jgi:hypothetical protein
MSSADFNFPIPFQDSLELFLAAANQDEEDLELNE